MSTERIAKLQTLLDRIKNNGALGRPASNLVFGGAKASQNDVATGPAVPAAVKQNDVVGSVAPIRPEIETLPPPVADLRTPPLTGTARIPTIAGMASPVAHPEPVESAAVDVIEELDIDEIDVVDITEESVEDTTPSSVEVAQVVSVETAPEATAYSIPAQEVHDDELRWSSPPTHDSVPSSAPRPRVAASSLDEALAEAAEAESTEPLKTPPPESGRQPTEGVYAAVLPTAEQLGETVELEAPTSAELELDLSQVAQKPKEELEFELPAPPSALESPMRSNIQTYTNEVEPESSVPEQSQVRSLPEEIDTVETPALAMPQDAPAPSTDRDSLPPAAELTTRQTEGREVEPVFVFAARKFEPKSFAELLDASLALVPKL